MEIKGSLVQIREAGFFFLKNNYYNNIYYKYEAKNAIDISLKDIKNEYINNDMYICEEKCDFK